MPITEQDMSVQDMKVAISRGAKCGECESRLNIAWGGSLGINGYILRCSDLDHHTIRAINPKSKERLEGEKTFRRIHKLKGTELETMTQPQMLGRVEMARFPSQLTIPQKKLIAKIAIEYGLDPLMGELLIIHGGLFVPLSARLRKAQETNKFDGINTEPATPDQRAGRGYSEGDFLWRAEVWIKGAIRPFAAFGGVKKKEIDKAISQAKANNRDPEALPLVKDPAQHAEKRAISRALRMGFHLPLPSAEDVGSEENGVQSSVVIESTGEIIKPADITSQTDDKAPKTKAATDRTPKPKAKVEKAVVKTETVAAVIEPANRGPGCPTCDFVGWVIPAPGDPGIPCPDCFGQAGSIVDDPVAADRQVKIERMATNTPEDLTPGANAPTTPGELLAWVASHSKRGGQQYDKTWVLVNFSWSDNDLMTRLAECYKEILHMTGWDPR